jgi:pyruvate,water dikinase
VYQSNSPVDCSRGEEGAVLKGNIEFDTSEVDINEIPELKIKIMVNLANPGAAFSTRKVNL